MCIYKLQTRLLHFVKKIDIREKAGREAYCTRTFIYLKSQMYFVVTQLL